MEKTSPEPNLWAEAARKQTPYGIEENEAGRRPRGKKEWLGIQLGRGRWPNWKKRLRDRRESKSYDEKKGRRFTRTSRSQTNF